MNYVPARIPFAYDSNATAERAENPSKEKSIQIDTQCGDSNEYQLSVSSTDAGLFEGSDRISVSDIPSDQRKKNSFYRWFKRKLWCIRRSKSTDSNRVKNQTFRNAKIEIRKPTSQEATQPEPTAPEEPEVKKSISVKSVHPIASAKKSTSSVLPPELPDSTPTVQKTPQVAIAPKERQVTFSDTVKTHIKTKYVTAEEYQQIRGMEMNNRTILYQYNRSVEPKSCIVQEKRTPVRNKSDHRKSKHTNENVIKI